MIKNNEGELIGQSANVIQKCFRGMLIREEFFGMIQREKVQMNLRP